MVVKKWENFENIFVSMDLLGKKKVLKLVHVTNFWSYMTYMAKLPLVACDHYGK